MARAAESKHSGVYATKSSAEEEIQHKIDVVQVPRALALTPHPEPHTHTAPSNGGGHQDRRRPGATSPRPNPQVYPSRRRRPHTSASTEEAP
eukprot:4803763-Prymnesium_polylepis.1